MNEASLYPQIRRFLERRGWKVGIEVPPRTGSPRRFDVVGVKPRKRQVTVVEVKLKEYRRIMDQTADRFFVADYVYIAFPIHYALTVLSRHSEELRRTRIGLLALDGSVHELIPPAFSLYVNTQRRDTLVSMVLGERKA